MACIRQTRWNEALAEGIIIPPKIGGLYQDPSGAIILWSGFDPDQPFLSHGCQHAPGGDAGDQHQWLCNTAKANKHRSWTKIKGSLHPGQCGPIGPKEEWKTKERYLTYKGTMCHGINPKDGEPKVKLSIFKKEIRQHMIVNGVYEIFEYNDGQNKCDLFQ